MYQLTLPGSWSRRCSANVEIDRMKTSIHTYNSQRKKTNRDIQWYIHAQLHGVKITEPFAFVMQFYEANRNYDPTNMHFLSKHVLDAAQDAKLIINDGWKQVAGNVLYEYFIDKNNPRVEVFFLCNTVIRVRPERILQQHLDSLIPPK